ncbi:AI-2E family transporter [Gammaproteobacteria bacterium]|nr:AI-2E family transporter [Gammaproteobacteria bacterium]
MKLLDFTLVSALVVLVFYLLIVGQGLLLPLVIALVFWFLINLLVELFSKIKIGKSPLPGWTLYSLSILTFMGIIWAIIELIAMNIDGVVEVAPTYQANLEARLDSLLIFFNIEEAPTLSQFTEIINLREIITNLASSLTSLAANGGIILIYLAFLLMEQGSLNNKLSALINNSEKEKSVRRLLRKIGEDVRKYITIKVITSTATGLLSYIFLRMVGVDFAAFWAVLIFLLNFIPTVGSIIATVFPALITLVQFDNLTPFFLVVGGVTAIQICIGNILEPKMMGNSLNLSPMIILLNLALWGMIWGVPGMFLCVPFLVISMIVFSHMPQTRAIAVILSRDGKIGETS